MALTFSARIGKLEPFIRAHTREDHRYGGLQLGVTSYHSTEADDDEEYRTTYLEWGGRSDHLSVPLASALGEDLPTLLTSSISDEDADYVRKHRAQNVTALQVIAG